MLPRRGRDKSDADVDDAFRPEGAGTNQPRAERSAALGSGMDEGASPERAKQKEARNVMRPMGTDGTFGDRHRCVALSGLWLHGGTRSQGGALRLSPRRSALGWFVVAFQAGRMGRADFAPKGPRQISPGQSAAPPWVRGWMKAQALKGRDRRRAERGDAIEWNKRNDWDRHRCIALSGLPVRDG